MILLCSGQISQRHFDALILLALQLERRGHSVAIDQRFLPNEITRQNRYEIAPFLADIADIAPPLVLVVGAETIADDVQFLLGSLQTDPEVKVWALGHFDGLQDEINARNKIAYALGIEPSVLHLDAQEGPRLLADSVTPLVTEITSAPAQSNNDISKILVYLPCEDLESGDEALNQISALNYSPSIDLHVVTNSKGKDIIRKSRHAGLSVFSYAEFPPTDLMHFFDILVFFGTNVPGERMAALALNAMGAGKVVIDCTEAKSFSVTGAPVLQGPSHGGALPDYLHDTVIRHKVEIGKRIQQSDWLRPFDISGFEHALELSPPPKPEDDNVPKTHFFPTNGNGLGHAQRCALIATEFKSVSSANFAVFPSCLGMIQSRGFSSVPMVSRSTEHGEEYASDILNYLRLRSLVRANDQLVFDGGYVFDSVYRLVTRLQIPAVWIRRGLWRPGQIHPVALERERVFSKVIVPTEAFDELNTDYSAGDHVHRVGPIVQRKTLTAGEIESLRERLSVTFDRSFDKLVVTMLGGGVASDRTAHTQFLCSLLEQRAECLHLIFAWPNARVAGALYGWKNSYVVNSHHALDLCQAADLCVSAAGYNSFHELIYAQVPTIFIPQSASYLDDQESRARAAFERNLAGFVQGGQLLGLEREVTAFLDDGKAQTVRQALYSQDMPETGNEQAARLIEEGLVL